MLYYDVSTMLEGRTGMPWKFKSGIPLSSQIADMLRADILSGKYTSGSQFPTVRQLAYDAGVNPNTMQKALSLLEGEGLIAAKSTSGRVVTTDLKALGCAREKVCYGFAKEVAEDAKRLSINRDELIKYIKEVWDNE